MHAKDCVFSFGADDFRFRFVDASALAHIGYSRSELSNMHPWDLKPEFSAGRFKAHIQPLADGRVGALHFETLHRRADGVLVPVCIDLRRDVADRAAFRAVVREKDAEGRVALVRQQLRLVNQTGTVDLRDGIEALAGLLEKEAANVRAGRVCGTADRLAYSSLWLRSVLV